MIYKFFKRQVKGKENLDQERFCDAISFSNEDLREDTNLQIKHQDKEKYLLFIEADELSYFYLEDCGDHYVPKTEEEYNDFRYANIELYA